MLRDYTKDGVKLIADAVRATSPVFEKLEDDQIVRMMVKHDYSSVLEHVKFTFELKDISVALSREVLEHRMASHTAKSTRYVSQKGGMSVYIPPKVLEDSYAREIFKDHVARILDLYRYLEKSYGREEARYVLPLALRCTYVWTINARSLINFLHLRLCVCSAPEMRELASLIKAKVTVIYPEIFESVDCRGSFLGICPEPKERSCGKYPTLEVFEGK